MSINFSKMLSRLYCKKRLQGATGFTLVEMIVAVGIFSMIAVISTAATISIIDYNKKIRSSKEALENMNFALESMSRAIRYGKDFYCGDSGTGFSDCPYTSPSSRLSFTDVYGRRIRYRLNSSTHRIDRQTDSNLDGSITSEGVNVTSLEFVVRGSDSTNNQPMVQIMVSGSVIHGNTPPSYFNLQTLVSSRNIILR